MRIPAGVSIRQLSDVLMHYEVELGQTDYGPVLYGKKEELEKARDHIIKALNERISELGDREKES